MTATRIAARLNGQPDLYAALRAAVTDEGTAPPLADILAACDAPPAARLRARPATPRARCSGERSRRREQSRRRRSGPPPPR